MTAKSEVSISVDVSGLGSGINAKDIFIDTVAPEVALKVDYQVQEEAGEEEILNIGAVDTVRGILLKAIDGDLNVDTSFDATFSAEITIKGGQSHYFCPSGVVYVCGADDEETVAYSYVVFGTQD